MLKLLLIDDDPDFLKKFLQRTKGREGLAVQTCDNPRELDVCIEREPPDCILLDFFISQVVTVEEVALRLRASAITAPIILISASGFEELSGRKVVFRRLFSLGVRQFLRKGALASSIDIWLDSIAYVVASERYLSSTRVFGDVYLTTMSLRGLQDRAKSELELLGLDRLGTKEENKEKAMLDSRILLQGIELARAGQLHDWVEKGSLEGKVLRDCDASLIEVYIHLLRHRDPKEMNFEERQFSVEAFRLLSPHLSDIDKSLIADRLLTGD